MKNILITGKNSYVGMNLEKWLSHFPDRYSIDSISLRDNSWKKISFSKYDVVLNVAGIAHVKETKINTDLYYKVNRDLAYKVAQKAKAEGVKQFIFLSSMSVYGIENGVIDKNSPLNPRSIYGKSKLEAEELITTLEDNVFKVAILRPPMIYGKGCKGNYNKLSKIAIKTPIFPDINNRRSMIFIDNLSDFIKWVIDNFEKGVFLPQNIEYVKTSNMVKLIAKQHGKRIWMTRLFNPILKIMKNNGTVNKVFGNLVYEQQTTSGYNFQYKTFVDFEDSIRLTEEE